MTSLIERAARLVKHYGPGDHPSGSPQSVHGRQDSSSAPPTKSPFRVEYSGISEIDSAITDFLNQPLGDWTTDDTLICDIDREQAHGSCQSIAEQFHEFAQARGLNSYVSHTDMKELGYRPRGPAAGEVMDGKGRIVTGYYNDHVVVEIYPPRNPERPYARTVWPGEESGWSIIVDFTAIQYGYKAHPKVLSDYKDNLKKHAGPGDHPGTGTPQTVHGQGGSGFIEVTSLSDIDAIEGRYYHSTDHEVTGDRLSSANELYDAQGWWRDADYEIDDFDLEVGQRGDFVWASSEPQVEYGSKYVYELEPVGDNPWGDSGGNYWDDHYFNPEGHRITRRWKIAESIAKHYGPGPHPGTGTPQSIHGSGGGINAPVATALVREKHAALFDAFPGAPDDLFDHDSGYRWFNQVFDQIKGNEALEAQWRDDLYGYMQSLRDVRNDNVGDLKKRVTLGEIEIDEAVKLGLPRDSEYERLGPLPDTLYHVTTATDAVVASGLKTRSELDQSDGHGLGGGTSDTISFTSDEEIARGIYNSMVERHAVLNDPATHIPRLVAEAKSGYGADREWWGTPDQPSTMAIKWEGESSGILSGGLDNLIEGIHEYRGYGIDAPKTPEELKAFWTGGSMNKYYSERYDLNSIELAVPATQGQFAVFRVKRTPFGHAEAIGDFMDEYSLRRESSGGPLDPLFIMNDDYAFKSTDISQISIIKGTTKPNTKGYQVSALGEWRTWDGGVLDQWESLR